MRLSIRSSWKQAFYILLAQIILFFRFRRSVLHSCWSWPFWNNLLSPRRISMLNLFFKFSFNFLFGIFGSGMIHKLGFSQFPINNLINLLLIDWFSWRTHILSHETLHLIFGTSCSIPRTIKLFRLCKSFFCSRIHFFPQLRGLFIINRFRLKIIKNSINNIFHLPTPNIQLISFSNHS